MNSQIPKLKLGAVCLDDYVSAPVEMEENKRKEIDNLIKQLEDNALNVEQLPLKLLKIQRAQYHILKPEFLTMHNTIKYKGQEVQVPKFSVYRKSKEGFDDFSFSMITDEEQEYFFSSFFNIPYKLEIQISEVHDLLSSPIIKSFGFGNREMGSCADYLYCFINLPKELWGKYKRVGDIDLTSHFVGILPQKSKEKIKEAESIFGRESYLIAETKPEAWETRKIVRDPLLVGILENKCYLVDHFNTTSIEDYVKSEFTE